METANRASACCRRCAVGDEKLKAERDEARALVLGLFRTCAGFRHPISLEWDHYDIGDSEAMRTIQDALISWGMVKREECVRE